VAYQNGYFLASHGRVSGGFCWFNLARLSTKKRLFVLQFIVVFYFECSHEFPIGIKKPALKLAFLLNLSVI
jgi:hypothetical protein